jgi:hypothetical protein
MPLSNPPVTFNVHFIKGTSFENNKYDPHPLDNWGSAGSVPNVGDRLKLQTDGGKGFWTVKERMWESAGKVIIIVEKTA